ncbi:MAG TPA: hypothetical protein VGL82_15225 [Bryobacteraceae bacterium]|jgi:hypothetical protein
MRSRKSAKAGSVQGILNSQWTSADEDGLVFAPQHGVGVFEVRSVLLIHNLRFVDVRR